MKRDLALASSHRNPSLHLNKFPPRDLHSTSSDELQFLGAQFCTDPLLQKPPPNPKARYLCLLCHPSKKIQTRGSFKRHVEEKHQPRVLFRCPIEGCDWIAFRRHKVRHHLLTRHKWHGNVDAKFISELGSSEEAPNKCSLCAKFVVSWDEYFACIENHCRTTSGSSLISDHVHGHHGLADSHSSKGRMNASHTNTYTASPVGNTVGRPESTSEEEISTLSSLKSRETITGSVSPRSGLCDSKNDLSIMTPRQAAKDIEWVSMKPRLSPKIVQQGSTHAESSKTPFLSHISSSDNFGEVSKKDQDEKKKEIANWVTYVSPKNNVPASISKDHSSQGQSSKQPLSTLGFDSRFLRSASVKTSTDDSEMFYGDDESIFCMDTMTDPLPWDPTGSILKKLKFYYANYLSCLVLGNLLKFHRAHANSDNTEATTSSRSSVQGRNQHNHGKRKLDQMPNGYTDEEQNDDDDDDDYPPQKFCKPTSSKDSRILRFACPFFKRHPTVFRLCGLSDHLTPSRVKQHIRRTHRRPLYCPRCWEVFKTEKDLDIHMRLATCKIQLGKEFIYATERQLNQLSKRSTDKSYRENWNSIYKILFPNDRLPVSPYLDSTVSEDVNAVREAFLVAIPEAQRQVLRQFAPQGLTEQHISEIDDRLRLVHVEVFEEILDSMRESRAPRSRRRSRTVPIPSLELPDNRTLPSDLADSMSLCPTTESGRREISLTEPDQAETYPIGPQEAGPPSNQFGETNPSFDGFQLNMETSQEGPSSGVLNSPISFSFDWDSIINSGEFGSQ